MRPYFSRFPFLVALLLAVSPAVAAGLPYEVDIDAPEEISDLLKDNLGVVRWRGSDYVDKDQLERLFQATPTEITNLLAPQGYFSPKIDTAMRNESGVWHVHVTVDPGQQCEIVDVDVTLTGPIHDEPDFQARYAALLESWLLPIGAPFKQQDWDTAKRRGLQSLVVDRFPTAHLASSHGDVDPVKGTATLTVVYDSGPRFTMGDLEAKGLKRYPISLVKSMATYQPGDPYNQRKLLDYQTALQNTPYFSSVFLDAPVDAAHPDRVPVQLSVVEAPIYKADTGLGYDTDTGARTSFGLRDADMFHRGWIGSVGLNIQQKQQIFDAGLQLPPDADGFRYASGFEAMHQNIAGLSLWEQTVGIQRSRLRDGTEITQRLQYVRSVQSTSGEEEQINFAFMPSQSWTRRVLDNGTDPNRGFILNLQLGGAARGVLSSASFVRTYGKLAWYVPTWSGSFLLLRGQLGEVFTKSPNSVPEDWLFRTGGADSVRGYGYQTLGVDGPNGAIIGGRVLATGSIELQQRIIGHWRGAIFTDAGGAADRWQSYHADKGYGVGVRWASPVGPFAGDIAYGADERRVRFQFSLGVGF